MVKKTPGYWAIYRHWYPSIPITKYYNFDIMVSTYLEPRTQVWGVAKPWKHAKPWHRKSLFSPSTGPHWTCCKTRANTEYKCYHTWQGASKDVFKQTWRYIIVSVALNFWCAQRRKIKTAKIAVIIAFSWWDFHQEKHYNIMVIIFLFLFVQIFAHQNIPLWSCPCF